MIASIIKIIKKKKKKKINENQANINESRIEYGNKNFNIKDLLHDD
jgi:hypothetical protein